jgi:hypothetical protein
MYNFRQHGVEDEFDALIWPPSWLMMFALGQPQLRFSTAAAGA